MKKVIAILLSLLCAPAAAQNYLRDDGIFHSVVEGTTNGQILINNGGQLGGTAIPSIPLTIGTSTITGGAAGRVLYDNSGVLGEYTVTGTGTVVARQNAPTFTGVVTVSRNATAWTPLGTTSLHIKGGDSGEARVEWTAANSDAVSVYGRLNNTFASPQPLVADDQVMGLVGEGIDTPGSTTMQQGGALGGFASQNWTPFHHGYYFRFFGINDNTIDIVDFGTFRNQGLALVGGLTAASFNGNTITAGSGTLTLGSVTLNAGAGGTLGALATVTPGTGVATALAVNIGTAGSFVTNGGALGTPSSGTATNFTGLPLTTGVTGILPVANGGVNLSAWTSYSPVPVAQTPGVTPPTFTVNSASYWQNGKTIIARADVSVTAAGTGSGGLRIPLPFAAANFTYIGSSAEVAVTGVSGAAFVAALGTFMSTATATNATYIVTGQKVVAEVAYAIP